MTDSDTCECIPDYEYAKDTTTCIAECPTHLTRHSVDDTCVCADASHEVITVSGDLECHPKCGDYTRTGIADPN